MRTDLFPYEGFRVRGLPRHVLVRGRIVKDAVGGPCLDFEPRGRLLKRKP
jgi:hypothetical protein